MDNNKINLDKLPKAIHVTPKFFEIKASDNKTYLCELLISAGDGYESFIQHEVIPEEKERVKNRLIRKLSEKNINPDIVCESDYVTRKARDSFVSNYTISAYKIIKELD